METHLNTHVTELLVLNQIVAMDLTRHIVINNAYSYRHLSNECDKILEILECYKATIEKIKSDNKLNG
jgi:hypothetical protein